MKTSLFLVLMSILLPAVHCKVKDAIIHEPVTLPCFCDASTQNVEWRKFLPFPESVIIKHGEETNGTKHSRVAFTGDTSKGDFSITFSRAVYNDAGSYMCSCNTTSDIKLQVLVPLVVTASVGDFKDVTWIKDGQVVWPDTSVNKENVFKVRLSVFPEGFVDGEFSLHISSVQPSDAGLYRCFFNQETDDGEPRAVSLNVQHSNKESQPSANICSALLITASVVGGISVIAIFCFGLYCTLKTRKRENIFKTKASVQETELLDVKMSSTQPF